MKIKSMWIFTISVLFLVQIGWAADEKLNTIKIKPKKVIDFPTAHFPHMNYAKEAWRFTGTLKTDKLENFNFIFIVQRNLENYRAIVQVFDISKHKKVLFREYKQQFKANDEKFHLNIGKAFLTYNSINDTWTFGIDDSKNGLNIRAKALRPYTLNSFESNKSQQPKSKKRYYSAQDMIVNGTLSLDGKSVFVTGKHTWLDHLWSNQDSLNGHYAHQWFSCRFDNNSGLLMEFQVNKFGQAVQKSKFAIFQDKDNARQINRFYLKALGESIQSPNKLYKFPVEWRVSVPNLKLRYSLKADVDKQWITSMEGDNFYAGSASIFDSEKNGFCFFGISLENQQN